MKDEWLTFYSIFLATETVHIPQLKCNSAAVLQFRSQKTSLFKSAYLSHTKSAFDDSSTVGKILTRSTQ